MLTAKYDDYSSYKSSSLIDLSDSEIIAHFPTISRLPLERIIRISPSLRVYVETSSSVNLAYFSSDLSINLFLMLGIRRTGIPLLSKEHFFEVPYSS